MALTNCVGARIMSLVDWIHNFRKQLYVAMIVLTLAVLLVGAGLRTATGLLSASRAEQLPVVTGKKINTTRLNGKNIAMHTLTIAHPAAFGLGDKTYQVVSKKIYDQYRIGDEYRTKRR